MVRVPMAFQHPGGMGDSGCARGQNTGKQASPGLSGSQVAGEVGEQPTPENQPCPGACMYLRQPGSQGVTAPPVWRFGAGSQR